MQSNHMKRRFDDPILWTNLLFVLPLLITLLSRSYIHSAVIALCIIFSTLYHMHYEKKYKIIDMFLAYLLIAFNLRAVLRSQPLFFAAAIILVALSGYIYYFAQRRNYNKWHPLWHAVSFAITTTCSLGYFIAVST